MLSTGASGDECSSSMSPSPGTEYEPKRQLLGHAVAESFFSSLKKERIKKQINKNRELAKADMADYIDTFYNRIRRHSHLGGLSPEQFEAAHTPRRRGLH
jgi:transposase InsO family protein